jgi:3-hydroxyacyl-CoA dehydrogenase/enoyl-CoA hydratase/3-hydroxybutyryl-CoA epimerase
MEKLLADGRLGRKAKKGFYTYDGGKKRVDESVYALLPGATTRHPIEARDAQERLGFAFLNESVLCLQEGILRSPRDGDVGAIFGLGFPPFLGGPFRHLDHLGARFVLERMGGRGRHASVARPDAPRPGLRGALSMHRHNFLTRLWGQYWA